VFIILTKRQTVIRKELNMKGTRHIKAFTLAAEFFFLCTMPFAIRAQIASPGPMPAHRMGPTSSLQKRNSDAEDDFAGLTYGDEQKGEIEKIHHETKSRQEVVAKDDKLNSDQKEAMILGYTRMEYGEIYKVLTPEQKKQVQQKIRDRRAEQEAAKKRQLPDPK
jgi:Spy/CpxP family protein refolding chaperone